LGDYEISLPTRRSGGSPVLSLDIAEVLQTLETSLQRVERLAPFLPEDMLARLVNSTDRHRRLESEFRPVAVQFIFIAGLEDLAVTQGADLATAALQRYFIQAQEIINRHEGVVSQIDTYGQGFILLNTFGAPRAHEGTKSYAVSAALQLARALVLDRDILLLDEPLAALDAQLRKDMCLELKHLQEQVGVTFIHVTHNQEEAMTVANRIALIADGKLAEQGTARQIYEAPRRRFTASFVGENNLIDGTIADVATGTATLHTGTDQITVPCDDAPSTGSKATLSIRSELVAIAPAGGDGLAATFVESVYLGLTTSHRVRLGDGTEIVSRVVSSSGPPPEPGAPVTVTWPQDSARLHIE
jgi:class 3 adenylate cyclase